MYSRWNGRPRELNKIIIWKVTFWNFKPLNFYSKHTLIEVLNRKEEKKLTVIRQNENLWKNRKHKTLEAYIIFRLGSSFYPVINSFSDCLSFYKKFRSLLILTRRQKNSPINYFHDWNDHTPCYSAARVYHGIRPGCIALQPNSNSFCTTAYVDSVLACYFIMLFPGLKIVL